MLIENYGVPASILSSLNCNCSRIIIIFSYLNSAAIHLLAISWNGKSLSRCIGPRHHWIGHSRSKSYLLLHRNFLIAIWIYKCLVCCYIYLLVYTIVWRLLNIIDIDSWNLFNILVLILTHFIAINNCLNFLRFITFAAVKAANNLCTSPFCTILHYYNH